MRENRLRRMAERQGLRLMKSRRRDPRAIDFGTYWLVGQDDAYFIPGGASLGTMRTVGFSIDELEFYLQLETRTCETCGEPYKTDPGSARSDVIEPEPMVTAGRRTIYMGKAIVHMCQDGTY